MSCIRFMITTLALCLAFACPSPVPQHSLLVKLQPKLVNAAGEQIQANDIGGAKYSLLYFSASWCAPCCKFTPKLVEAHPDLESANIKVVLVGRDRNRAAFLKYMRDHHQPWAGIAREDQEGMDLAGYAESGIPSLCLIDHEGKVLLRGIAWSVLPKLLEFVEEERHR